MASSPAHRAQSQVTCGELTRGELKELLTPSQRPSTTSNAAARSAAYSSARPRTQQHARTRKRRGQGSRSPSRRPRTCAASTPKLPSAFRNNGAQTPLIPETPESSVGYNLGLDFGESHWNSPQELLLLKENAIAFQLALIGKDRTISEQSSQLKRLNQEKTRAVIEQSKLAGEARAMRVRPWTTTLPAARGSSNVQADEANWPGSLGAAPGNNNTEEEEYLTGQVESLEATVLKMSNSELDTKRQVERLQKDNRDLAQALLRERIQARQLAMSLDSNIHTRLTVPSFPCIGETNEAKHLALDRQWRAQKALESITSGVKSAKTLEALLKSERGTLKSAVKERANLYSVHKRQEKSLALKSDQVTALKQEVHQLREAIGVKDQELVRQQGSIQRFSNRQEKFSRAVEALERLEDVAREKERRQTNLQEHYQRLDTQTPSSKHRSRENTLAKRPTSTHKNKRGVGVGIALPAISADVSTTQHFALRSAITTLVKENKSISQETKQLQKKLAKAEAGLVAERKLQLKMSGELSSVKELLNAKKTNTNARSRLMSRQRSSNTVGGFVVNVLRANSCIALPLHNERSVDTPETLDEEKRTERLYDEQNNDEWSLMQADSVVVVEEGPSMAIQIEPSTKNDDNNNNNNNNNSNNNTNNMNPTNTDTNTSDNEDTDNDGWKARPAQRQSSQAAIALSELSVGRSSMLLGPPSTRGINAANGGTANENMTRTVKSMTTLVNEDMHGSYTMTSNLIAQLMDVIHWTHNIGNTIGLSALSRQVERKAQQLCPSEHVTLYLVNSSRTKLHTRLHGSGAQVEIPINHGVPGFVAMRGEALHIPNVVREVRFNDEILQGHTGAETRNLLAIPLWSPVDQQVMGVLLMTNKIVSGDSALERLARRHGMGGFMPTHTMNHLKPLSNAQELSLSFSIVEEELLQTFLSQVSMLINAKRREYVDEQKLNQFNDLFNQLPRLHANFVTCAPMISHEFVHQIEYMCAKICGVKHAVIFLFVPRSSEDDEDDDGSSSVVEASAGLMWTSQKSWSRRRQSLDVSVDSIARVVDGDDQYVREETNSRPSTSVSGSRSSRGINTETKCTAAQSTIGSFNKEEEEEDCESIELGSKYIPLTSSTASIASHVLLTGKPDTNGLPSQHGSYNPDIDMTTSTSATFISLPILTPELGYTSSELFAEDPVGPALGCVQLEMPDNLDGVELRDKISRCVSVISPFLKITSLNIDAMWQVIDLAEMADGEAWDANALAVTKNSNEESDVGNTNLKASNRDLHASNKNEDVLVKDTSDFGRRARRNTKLRVRANLQLADYASSRHLRHTLVNTSKITENVEDDEGQDE